MFLAFHLRQSNGGSKPKTAACFRYLYAASSLSGNAADWAKSEISNGFYVRTPFLRAGYIMPAIFITQVARLGWVVTADLPWSTRICGHLLFQICGSQAPPFSRLVPVQIQR